MKQLLSSPDCNYIIYVVELPILFRLMQSCNSSKRTCVPISLVISVCQLYAFCTTLLTYSLILLRVYM